MGYSGKGGKGFLFATTNEQTEHDGLRGSLLVKLRRSRLKSPKGHGLCATSTCHFIQQYWLPDMGDAFIFGPWVRLLAALALANLQRVSTVDGTACEEPAKAGNLLQARRSMAMIDGEEIVQEAGWNYCCCCAPICWQIKVMFWEKVKHNNC